ncbi:beta strand repeat-containing protein [Hyphomicrobium sp.]|uniref:beta strand repeat-containing protein n=1 Tax=Hyphomicrobium sp. TaxID=82 RepID=UPI003F70B94F
MSFIGKTIQFEWFNNGVLKSTQSATVGAGAEFTITPGIFYKEFDLGGDEITQSFEAGGGYLSTVGGDEYVFTDINNTLPQIVNAAITIGGNATPPTVTFTSDVIKLTFAGRNSGSSGLNYVVDVDFAGATVTAGDDVIDAFEDVTFSGNVLGNDTHSEADTLIVSSVSGGTVGAASTGTNGGTFVINADGSFTFDAGASFDYLRAGETATTSITYTARDSNFAGGPSDAATITVTINGESYAPSGTDNTVTILEGREYVFTLADFGFSDLDGDDFFGIVISNMTDARFGSSDFIRVNGAFISDGTFISAANIAAGLVKTTSAGNDNGPAHYTFDFQVVDDGGTLNGGVNIDATPNRFTVDITPVNNSPNGADKTLTTSEDTPVTLSVADFGFRDVTDGDGFSAVKITTLPTAGTLTNNGVALSTGDFVSVAAITAGLLKFVPALNANGAGYASFTFQVQDDGGTLNGGRDTDLTPNTITIDVNAVNDAPALVASNLKTSIAENTSTAARIKIADLAITDVDGGPNALSISGADAARFEIVGNALYLKAGTALDFETKNTYAVTVNVDDPTINGNAIEFSRNFTLGVTDVNEAPTAIAFTNATTTLAENVSTAAARTVATIVITDDALGTETLTLTGADAGLFQVVGNALQIKAGAALDFETNPVLDVVVNVNDPTINGNAIELSRAFQLKLTDALEVINGTSGPNTLNGTNTGEIINGLAGNDIINGNGGNDRIIGGAGIDILTGGAGSDTFIFATLTDSGAGYSGYVNNGGFSPLSGNGQRDIITDFTPGTDKIDVSAIDANTKLGGDQAFSFLGAAAFTGVAGQLVYARFDLAGTANDRTIVYADVNGDRLADMQIDLAGLKFLTSGDFIL